MALADLVLKAKVNLALAQDPRVGVLDIGVAADDGVVTLTGDLDNLEECGAAEEIAERVEGVVRVENHMTCGMAATAETAEMVRQKFLERLDDAWEELPDMDALTQADYLRWALWMVYKFQIPESLCTDESARIESETVEEALSQIASRVGASKAVVALEMLKQAEAVAESWRRDAPDIVNAPLTATPENP